MELLTVLEILCQISPLSIRIDVNLSRGKRHLRKSVKIRVTYGSYVGRTRVIIDGAVDRPRENLLWDIWIVPPRLPL